MKTRGKGEGSRRGGSRGNCDTGDEGGDGGAGGGGAGGGERRVRIGRGLSGDEGKEPEADAQKTEGARENWRSAGD